MVVEIAVEKVGIAVKGIEVGVAVEVTVEKVGVAVDKVEVAVVVGVEVEMMCMSSHTLTISELYNSIRICTLKQGTCMCS